MLDLLFEIVFWAGLRRWRLSASLSLGTAGIVAGWWVVPDTGWCWVLTAVIGAMATAVGFLWEFGRDRGDPP